MKKIQKPHDSTSSLTVGLDIGYGVTKAISSAAQTVLFPSVLGHAREIKFNADEIGAKYLGDQITDEDGDWFVGDLALSQVPSGELLKLRGRTSNEDTLGNVFRVRLAKVALGKLLPGRKNGDVVHVEIATGLPVDHMRGAAALKAALIGQHIIRTNDTHIIANVTKVMVMPQPYGTIYANTLTEKGEINPCHTATRTGVVDVGTYTVDVTLDDSGEYIEAESGSQEAGVYTAQERIASALERDYGEKPRYKTVEEVLRTSCIRIDGAAFGYEDEVQEALAPLRSATVGLMSEKWQAARFVDVIYISGGGAELVFRDIKSAYKQAQIVKDSQLANARGYLNYARFQSQD